MNLEAPTLAAPPSVGALAPSFAATLRDMPLAEFVAAARSTTAPGGRVGAILAERLALQDEAAEALRADLLAFTDGLAQKIEDAIAADGGDARTAVQARRLDDWLQFLDDIGLAEREDAWYQNHARLAGLAEETLGAMGIADADRALDGEAAQSAIAYALDADRDRFWANVVARPSAARIMDGLRSSIEAQPLSEIARTIARDEGVSLPQAATKARTRIAEYDAFVSAEAARQADPDGEVMLWAYTGPDDGLERPFCDRLNGMYFTLEQVGQLDNHQPDTGHPMTARGGWNCRHQWLHAPADTLDALGYKRGADSDVDAANVAAASR